jgi:hypothetical protein
MSHDSSYVRETLLPGVVAYLTRALRARSEEAVRGAGMCRASLGVTAAGYSWQLTFGGAAGRPRVTEP